MTALSIAYSFGELALVIVLLAIFTAKPRPQPQDEWGSHDEPFEYDTDYSDEEQPEVRKLKFY